MPALGSQRPATLGIFCQAFGTAGEFFADNIVLNYCPLLFLHTDSKRCVNLTPDKLSATDKEPLYAACDSYLRVAVECFRPDFLIGVGGFAERRLINYSAMINRLSAKFYIPARLARRLIGALKKRRPNNCKHSAFLRIKIQYGGNYIINYNNKGLENEKNIGAYSFYLARWRDRLTVDYNLVPFAYSCGGGSRPN